VNDSTIETPVATGGKDKGFTLIELLIVIVILGVLATVTVFAVRGVTSRGEKSSCQADYKTIETAIETWHAESANQRADTAPLNVASMQDLVDSEFIRTASNKYDINATGAIIVLTGSTAGCTAPPTA
jgi:prepilin-type N-terminal cleavage/methylation domain-containing protein